jgi:hypothetical protein
MDLRFTIVRPSVQSTGHHTGVPYILKYNQLYIYCTLVLLVVMRGTDVIGYLGLQSVNMEAARSPKRRYPTTSVYGVTSQNTATWILTAVKTPSLGATCYIPSLITKRL